MYRIVFSAAAIVALSTVGLGQTSETVQTGFAVVRPLIGFGDGLMLFEKLTHRTADTDFQGTIPFGPFVTSTALVVNPDAVENQNSGIAIVNPGNFAVQLTLTLKNSQGGTVATKTMILEPLHQISKFVTQLFDGQPGTQIAGLLSISATGAIAVAGLLFRGNEFSLLPTTATGVNAPPSGLLAPQVAVGSNWSTEIVIANRLGTGQKVAVDIYSSSGRIIGTVDSVNLPAGGTAVVSLTPETLQQ